MSPYMFIRDFMCYVCYWCFGMTTMIDNDMMKMINITIMSNIEFTCYSFSTCNNMNLQVWNLWLCLLNYKWHVMLSKLICWMMLDIYCLCTCYMLDGFKHVDWSYYDVNCKYDIRYEWQVGYDMNDQPDTIWNASMNS